MDEPKVSQRRPRTQVEVGQRFARLVIVSLDVPNMNISPSHPSGIKAARCLCDCGTEVTIVLGSLKAGRTKSCGCLHREVCEQRSADAHAPRNEKPCNDCGTVKPLAEFGLRSNRPDGHDDRCKPCMSQYRKRLYDPARELARFRLRMEVKANRDKAVERNRRWVQANPDKARAKVERHRESVRTQVFDHYGRTCACCGGTEDLTIDHVSGGGSQHRLEVLGRKNAAGTTFYPWLIRNGFPGGFQTLCFPCNNSKGTRERCRLDHAAA